MTSWKQIPVTGRHRQCHWLDNAVAGTKRTYLSGGEQQRVVIARAFLKNAPIILLYVVTASLDVERVKSGEFKQCKIL